MTANQVLLVLAVSFLLGFFLGYFYGAKTEGGKFYKHPWSHWRIRGK